MNQALKQEARLSFPRRDAGEKAKARPCLGDHQAQLEKVRERSFARYENAYRDLAKV